MKIIKRLIGDRRGVTALEYGVIAAGIVVAVASIAPSLGDSFRQTIVAVIQQGLHQPTSL